MPDSAPSVLSSSPETSTEVLATALVQLENTPSSPSITSNTAPIPLTTPGNHTYKGFSLGLYPEGNNIPEDHLERGLEASSRITPRLPDGTPSDEGIYILMSAGMSNTSQQFCNPPGFDLLQCRDHSFMNLVRESGLVNRQHLRLVNGARGLHAVDDWNNPGDPIYQNIRTQILEPSGFAAAQVQAVWLKQANRASPTRPSLPDPNADARVLLAELGHTVRALKNNYPNLQVVFLSSRVFAGYAANPMSNSPEPYAFETGFAVKWLIEAQMKQLRTGEIDPLAGDLGPEVAPWLGWGPYLWANGSEPRHDNLSWQPHDFVNDGIHPSSTGIRKTASMLLEHLLNDPVSQYWFRSSPLESVDSHGSPSEPSRSIAAHIDSFSSVGCPPAAPSGSTCETASVTMPTGMQSRSIELMLTDPTSTADSQIRGTIVMFGGGSGSSFSQTSDTQGYGAVLSDLRQAGFRTVDRRWLPGWRNFNTIWGMDHRDVAPTAALLHELSQRFNDGPLCTIGFSGGSMELTEAFGYYDAGSKVNASVLTGGPSMARMDQSIWPDDTWVSWCEQLTTQHGLHPEPFHCDPVRRTLAYNQVLQNFGDTWFAISQEVSPARAALLREYSTIRDNFNPNWHDMPLLLLNGSHDGAAIGSAMLHQAVTSSYRVVENAVHNIFLTPDRRPNLVAREQIVSWLNEYCTKKPTSIEPDGDNPEIGGKVELYQNYPNPFNASTVIPFHIIGTPGLVRITVYDMLGREIELLLDEIVKPGIHEVTFNGQNLATGIYIVRLDSKLGYSVFRTILLLK
jgi:hypothetical protein